MKNRLNRSFSAAALVLSGLTLAPPLLAQAEGLMKQDPATKGTTDVATAGFEAPAAKEEESKDATEAKISAGGMQTTGNSRALALTAAGHFRLRRNVNQFTAAAAMNYARSAATPADDMATTVENYQGKVRYDRFILEKLALFIALSARRDRFQGLALRLNIDPGIAYYFLDEKKHQFWTEVGYDFQYDVRTDDVIAAAALEGEQVEKTDVQHSGRLFLGYSNALNEELTLHTGLEYLQGIPETEKWRLNWDLGLTSSIGGNFSLALTFSLKYDNDPLPNVENLDTTTALSLVYQLL